MKRAVPYAVGAILFFLSLFAGFWMIHAGLYGWTLFAVGPSLLGAIACWLVRPESARRAISTGMLCTFALLLFFFLLGWEGIICILMAAPLAVPLGALGGWLVYRARDRRGKIETSGVAMLLVLSPASLLWDVKAPPAVFEVRTAIEIAATPEQVWKHVVTFSELPEPTEWYFRAGIAYPQRARIEGSGPGAVRYCEFSTGPFVEPIDVWDEPRLLRFHVTSNPPPMREQSIYSKLEPKHLHGYLVSEQGQFLLTPLANGHTRLEGTTRYRHGLWPAQYWRLWSDAIIHRIHLRVLNQIRVLAEADATSTAQTPSKSTK